MSILILSTVRSGSSRLLQAISRSYNQEGIFEPTTPAYRANFNPKKDIVKIIIQTLPIEDLLELIGKFDKVVLLDRRDITAQCQSYLNLWKNLDGKYDTKYISTDFTDDEMKETEIKFNNWKKQLNKISTLTGLPIYYLEDLLEHKDIGVNYDKELFTEKYRLKQTKNSLI